MLRFLGEVNMSQLRTRNPVVLNWLWPWGNWDVLVVISIGTVMTETLIPWICDMSGNERPTSWCHIDFKHWITTCTVAILCCGNVYTLGQKFSDFFFVCNFLPLIFISMINATYCYILKSLTLFLPSFKSFCAFLASQEMRKVSKADKIWCPLRLQCHRNRLFNTIKVDWFGTQRQSFWNSSNKDKSLSYLPRTLSEIYHPTKQ